MKNNKGFSLVELIVVIAIMAILAAVAIPTFASFINKANVASDAQFVADIEYAVELANTATGKVTELKITAENGDVKTVTYKVDGDSVTINVTSNGATVDSSVTDDELKAAAQEVIDTIDWTYDFKSNDYASGN